MLTDLTGFQWDLLFVLNGMETPSGSEIMRELRNRYDRSVLNSQLYPNLDRLIEEGYVEKGEVDGRTNYYTITDEGIETLWYRHEWERELLETESNVHAE